MKTLNATLLASLLTLPASAMAADPINEPDQSWVSISGTVTSSGDESFKLDYGDGILTVEMDDWDVYGEAYSVVDGDKVTVYGRVDDSLYEQEKIEASSVYIEDLNTYFYASSADEEEMGSWVVTPVVEPGEVTYIGKVESVNDSKDTFTIDTGATTLSVDTSLMLYDPLDDQGFQQIDKGDRVSVTGMIDNDFFDQGLLEADTIVTLG